MNVGVDADVFIVRISDAEAIIQRKNREISILVAREEVTITHARYASGEQVAGPHIHHEHTDAFYVLEGELTFEIGSEPTTITVSEGGFVAAPPHVAHAFRTSGDRPARWLTIHAHDGGFAEFMRGTRDGVEVRWDISPVPADGGLAASEATVSSGPAAPADPIRPNPVRSVRCALPDLCVVEWQLRGTHPDPPTHDHAGQVHSFFVIEGELETTGARPIGAGTLISIPPGVPRKLSHGGPQHARVLSVHTPGGGAASAG